MSGRMYHVFISYARADLDSVLEIESGLKEAGILTWRDQEKLYGGQRWPKALGDAIAAQRGLLLFWSEAAATSHFVEVEWCTAFAMRKPIIPCLLDDTVLPSALSALQTVDCRQAEAGLKNILQALDELSIVGIEPGRTEAVLTRLSQISTTEPAEIVKEVRSAFVQNEWTVRGNVYQVAGDLHIGGAVQEPAKTQHSWATTLPTRMGILVALLTIASLVLDLPAKMQQALRTVSGGPNQDEAKPSRNSTGGLRAEVEGVKQAIGLLTAAPKTVLGEQVLCDTLKLNLVLANSGKPMDPISINSIAIQAKPISLSELQKGELCKFDKLSSVPYGIPDKDVYLVRIDDRGVKSHHLWDADHTMEVDSNNLLESNISPIGNILNSKVSAGDITLKPDGVPTSLYFAVQSTVSEPQEITFLISYDQMGEKTVATQRVILWK